MTTLLIAAADDEAAMLADIAQLTPEPAALAQLVAQLGYQPRPSGGGLFAPGEPSAPTLMFQLYDQATLAVRRRQLIGQHVVRSAAIAAGLAALRTITVRPSLLFVHQTQDVPSGIQPEHVVSLQGGVVPRIWRGCFGRMDLLLRFTGRLVHPGQPSVALNAIEQALPALSALKRLEADLQHRSVQRPQTPDAPLRPRITISAAHGGHSGSTLPSVFDVVVSRRYDPAEDMEVALAQIEDTARAAVHPDVSVELSVTHNQRPEPDPDLPNRNREARALVVGWGWPQIPFCSSAPLLPGATLFGGLDRPTDDPRKASDATTLDDMAALARSLRALLSGA